MTRKSSVDRFNLLTSFNVSWPRGQKYHENHPKNFLSLIFSPKLYFTYTTLRTREPVGWKNRFVACRSKRIGQRKAILVQICSHRIRRCSNLWQTHSTAPGTAHGSDDRSRDGGRWKWQRPENYLSGQSNSEWISCFLITVLVWYCCNLPVAIPIREKEYFDAKITIWILSVSMCLALRYHVEDLSCLV